MVALISALTGAGFIIGSFATPVIQVPTADPTSGASCDTVNTGYQCSTNISHYWGQYSPYFSVPSAISSDIPFGCQVTFANLLSRHGARFPTASKTVAYNATIAKIKSKAKSYPGNYSFLATYTYNLGADSLTTFGQQELINSGTKFYQRYRLLSEVFTPFVRASSEDRVVVSAQNFTQGFSAAKSNDVLAILSGNQDIPIEIISEAAGSNNTLNHDLCTNFETGPNSMIGKSAQATWAAIFTPPITSRLNANLGTTLTQTDTINLLDLCPFDTVASVNGTVSPFCNLFTSDEFRQYDYYQSLGKYYGYGNGNPLGPTQGVGYTNELIARLSNSAVNDHTSTNSTLDNNTATFPTGRGHPLFADFSHDNDLTGIFSALGLYNTTAPLSNTTVQTTDQTNGYSAAYTVPFGARAYVEKLVCVGKVEEQVRVLVNDRVVPLTGCGSDKNGLCGLNAFLNSLSFAKAGGRWNQCFN